MSRTASRTICMHAGSHAAGISKKVSRLPAALKTLNKQNVQWQVASLCSLGHRTRNWSTWSHSCSDSHLSVLSLWNSWPVTSNCQRIQVLLSLSSWLHNAAVVQAKTVWDMITPMELKRHRMTLVLPQWDLGIVLEALSKPYVLLWEASHNISPWKQSTS